MNVGKSPEQIENEYDVLNKKDPELPVTAPETEMEFDIEQQPINTEKEQVFQVEETKSCLQKADALDKYYSDFIHKLEVNLFMEIIIYTFSRFYNPEFVVIYFVIMFLYYGLKYGDYYFIVKPLIHVLVSLIITLILKKLFNRPRPTLDEKIKRQFNCRSRENNGSMPSGDALQSGVFSMAMIYYCDFYWFLITIPLVMFARVFYYCHYICDTIAGAILGIIISMMMYKFLKYY